MGGLRGRVLAVVVAVAGAMVAFAGPASANDLRFEFYSPYTGNLLAVGTYDDLTDKYCIRYVSGHTNATLTSTRASDGKDPRRVSDGPAAGATCTGNLSIPEDQYREVRISASEWGSGPRYHYT
jgi:hypothetical protein